MRPAPERKDAMPLLWIIVLILVVLAVAGGLAVDGLLWLLLVIALIVALFQLLSGRRAV
jgi:fatty acid desaturase